MGDIMTYLFSILAMLLCFSASQTAFAKMKSVSCKLMVQDDTTGRNLPSLSPPEVTRTLDDTLPTSTTPRISLVLADTPEYKITYSPEQVYTGRSMTAISGPDLTYENKLTRFMFEVGFLEGATNVIYDRHANKRLVILCDTNDMPEASNVTAD